jgi:hypothetical protein
MSDELTLKPCPFCGSMNVYPTPYAEVICPDCITYCRFGGVPAFVITPLLIEKWNRREEEKHDRP